MTRNEKVQLYLEGARKFFPDLKASTIFSMFSGELDSPSSGKIEFSGKSLIDKDIENGGLSIVHYTTFESFINIINNGNVRMYNCLNMNDSKELEFGIKSLEIELSQEMIDEQKRNYFIFSGSRYKSEEDENFNLWRFYGDFGKGIALVFEVPKEIVNWPGMVLNKVEYGQSQGLVKEFVKFHNDFQQAYKLFENVPDLFPLLSLFVKDQMWSTEQEYRILAHCPFDEYDLKPSSELIGANILLSKGLEHSINNRGLLVSYVNLPIQKNGVKDNFVKTPFSKRKVNLADYVPNIRLKEVIFGFNRKLDYNSGLYEFLEIVMPRKLGYLPKIRQSKFYSE